MARPQKRSRDDETGQLLVASGQVLLRTGTPLGALTLADAAELASKTSGATITTGAGYPRFGTQQGFRLAVLEAFLDSGPAYSDLALNGVSRVIQSLEDGRSEFLEPADVPTLIAAVAEEHQQAMARDSDLALRVYATWELQAIVNTWEGEKAESDRDGLPVRAKPESVARAEEVLARVREREEKINDEWVHFVKTLADEFGAAPLDDLEYKYFEIALTALRNGLIIRQATTGIPEDTLARLVSAIVLGFFEETREDDRRQSTIAEKLTALLSSARQSQDVGREMLRKETLRKLAAESRRRLSPISDEDVATADSPNVRRALTTLRDRGADFGS